MKFDFNSLNVSTKSNTREGVAKRQQFYFKLRVTQRKDESIVSRFTVSEDMWTDLNLEEYGIQYASAADANGNPMVLILTVTNEHAISLKKTTKGEKTKSFTSTVLEDLLEKAGIVDRGVVGKNQRMTLEDVTSNFDEVPSHVNAIYTVAVAEANEEADNDSEEEESEQDLD